jgi:hypothetical protein
VEPIRVVGEHMVNPVDLRVKLRMLSKAQEDDTRMRMLSDKDEFPEVSVIGDEDSLLSMGNRQNFWVGKACREIDRNGSDVMAK